MVGTWLLVITYSPLEEIAVGALLESHTADVELGLEALPHSSLLSGILVLGAQIVLDTAVVVGIRVLASPPSLLKELSHDTLAPLDSAVIDVDVGLKALLLFSSFSGLVTLGTQRVLDASVVVDIRVLKSPLSLLEVPFGTPVALDSAVVDVKTDVLQLSLHISELLRMELLGLVLDLLAWLVKLDIKLPVETMQLLLVHSKVVSVVLDLVVFGYDGFGPELTVLDVRYKSDEEEFDRVVVLEKELGVVLATTELTKKDVDTVEPLLELLLT